MFTHFEMSGYAPNLKTVIRLFQGHILPGNLSTFPKIVSLAFFYCIMEIPDILLDVFQSLELNEVEKSRWVSRGWNLLIRSSLGALLDQRRRIDKLSINRLHNADVSCFFNVLYKNYGFLLAIN